MTKPAVFFSQQLTEWIAHLYASRESLLNTWRTLCQSDLELTTRSSFSREEFNDQMPALLNIFSQRLQGEVPDMDSVEKAGQHGLHRWQRGYSLPELLSELDHFYRVLLDEFQLYVSHHPDLHPDLLSLVYRQLYQISRDSYQGSVIYFDRLRETNAAEQAANLQQALNQVNELVQLQDEHLQMSADDLRSSFGVLMGVIGATRLLEMPNTAKDRKALFQTLNLNLTMIRDMLLQLTDFARLEANQEELELKSFDVAVLLHELVATTQNVAKKQNLELKANGPAQLLVKSDRRKLQRIVQYLLVNALTNTKAGTIYVSWAQENNTRWILSVQDSGLGLTTGPAFLLAEQLKPADEPTGSHQPGGAAVYRSSEIPLTNSEKILPGIARPPGQGLALFIVKKFCELLKANMEIETSPGQGTLIRLRFLTDQSQ